MNGEVDDQDVRRGGGLNYFKRLPAWATLQVCRSDYPILISGITVKREPHCDIAPVLFGVQAGTYGLFDDSCSDRAATLLRFAQTKKTPLTPRRKRGRSATAAASITQLTLHLTQHC